MGRKEEGRDGRRGKGREKDRRRFAFWLLSGWLLEAEHMAAWGTKLVWALLAHF